MIAAGDDEQPVLEPPRDVEAAARSRLYALLAEAFSYPQGSPVIRLLDGDLAADINTALEASPLNAAPPRELITPVSKSAVHEMQVRYSELFDVISGTPKVSFLERRYGAVPEQELWQKLLSFYGHFGLDFSAGYASEQPDHLLTELGFMHYLAFLEAGIVGDKASLRRGQRDFLKLHLGSWTAALAAKIKELEGTEPYAGLAEFLAAVVESDLNHLQACLGDG